MPAIIRVEGISKKYVIGHQSRQDYDTLRDEIVRRARGFARRLIHPFSRRTVKEEDTRHEDFWALRDVSFEVREGETLGIIGRNGAGKSTLLKILSRITDPTNGRIALGGRVSSLLEVGTGFHPELSGRENIFLNGAVLGMGKAEILRKFDEIVDFAEIEKFLDTPVKHYSSGMYVRLAFAVAAHLEPEIMVVDEVLAVGDVKFQKKCLGKMEQVGQQGRTVLFVSHNMQAIRQLCDRAILLEGGAVVAEGTSGEIVDRYLHNTQAETDPTPESLKRAIQALPANPDCRFFRVAVLQDGRFSTRPDSGKPFEISLEYEVLREAYGFHVFFRLLDSEGSILFESMNCGEDEEIPNVQPGFYRSVATIPADFLAPRRYELTIHAGVAYVGHSFPDPLRINLDVAPGTRVNRLFPGYDSPGGLLPSIPWRLHSLSGSDIHDLVQ